MSMLVSFLELLGTMLCWGIVLLVVLVVLSANRGNGND